MRILILDEEPNIGRVLVCTVEPEHIAVAVQSWSEAWTLLQTQPFDVVAIDLHFRSDEGFTRLSQLASSGCCSAVIAYSTSSDREEALRCGAAGYLSQPFTPAEFRAELARISRWKTLPGREKVAASPVRQEWGCER